jgi:hypothetical protein
MKTCSKCKEEKVFSEFNIDSRTKSGLRCICRSCQSIQNAKMHLQAGEERLEKMRKYKHANRDTLRVKELEYQKKKRKEDPFYRVKHNIRTRFTKLFNGKIKCKHSLEALGCDLEFFKQYISEQFEPGMTWENYGHDTWHIEHIVPLDAAKGDVERIYELWHYTNLRPMSAQENWKKGSKY